MRASETVDDEVVLTNADTIQTSEFAGELNAYLLITKGCFEQIESRYYSETDFDATCDAAIQILQQSGKVDIPMRQQMQTLISQAKALLRLLLSNANAIDKLTSEKLITIVASIRSLFVDFMVSMQEQALYESNKPSSHASSLSDELGSLIELVTTQVHCADLHKCLMNMGHMIRVWLQLPRQALCFYQQALQNGMNIMHDKSIGCLSENQPNLSAQEQIAAENQSQIAYQEEESKAQESREFDSIVPLKDSQGNSPQRDSEQDEDEIDLEKVGESLKNQVAQIFFFLGITHRSLNMFDEAVEAYQNAINLNQYYSDCYYNLGNVFFEDKQDFQKAELCYKSALESLDEERSNQIYSRIDDLPRDNSQLQLSPIQSNDKQVQSAQPTTIQNTVTYGRICYMIGETCRSNQDNDQAFKYYLKGIESESSFNENFVAFAMLCRDMNEIEVSNVFIIFGKVTQQIKQMHKIFALAAEEDQSGIDLDELIFEEVEDQERSVIDAEIGDQQDNIENAIQEVRLKQDLHTLLVSAVCELKERIQSNQIEFKLLRAIHILQRLNEKMLNEIESRFIMANHNA